MESTTNKKYSGSKSEAKHLLRLYQIGSLVVLICGLLTVSLVCSISFANREGRRSLIYEKQIQDFFGFHYRRMSEEMWTKNYESIQHRVEQIARQLGSSVFDTKLIDENGSCVFYSASASHTNECDISASEAAYAKSVVTRSDSKPSLSFNPELEHYQYATPLHVGSIYKGVLFSKISDSYGFHQGKNMGHAMRLFLLSSSAVLLLWLMWLWASRVFILGRYTSVLAELEKKEALAKLAAQLSHDIRSPLSALTILVDSARSHLPNSQSQLLQLAISRITSIADDLLNRYRKPETSSKSMPTILSGVVHSIVSEKTVLLQGSDISLVSIVDPKCANTVVNVEADRIQRCLSNLLNNAMDAFDETAGEITIELKNRPKDELFAEDMITLIVRDNGKGMDPRTLQKVRTKGGSYGKKSGNGIGLSFAREVAAEVGGQLMIQSEKGRGTEICLILPSAPNPSWLSSSISVPADTTFVILDDDHSMHAFWQEKLRGFKLKHLYDPEEFSTSLYPPNECIYFLDHEIIGAPITGLDLIKMYHLKSRAFLVTSYFADPEIQDELSKVGAYLLPKFLSSSFKVNISGRDPLWETKPPLCSGTSLENPTEETARSGLNLSSAFLLMSPLL